MRLYIGLMELRVLQEREEKIMKKKIVALLLITVQLMGTNYAYL